MNGAVLQVLLILAFLAIGLISVTFPVYAISVNFLPKQKWEDEKERKKRMSDLEAKIKELTGRLGNENADTETIKGQLDKYNAERKGTELKYHYLTAKGAVLAPVIYLIFALLSAVFGIYAFYKDSLGGAIVLGVGSCIFSVVALFSLYNTISAVEYGALRPERTVHFDVGFGVKYEKRIEVELGKEKRILFFVRTPESEVEKLFTLLKFPAELGVSPSRSSDIVVSVYEEYTMYRYTLDYLPKGNGTGFSFSMTPNKEGEYTVNVTVYAKGTYEYKENLTVEVVC